jgi:hypothetical protein
LNRPLGALSARVHAPVDGEEAHSANGNPDQLRDAAD